MSKKKLLIFIITYKASYRLNEVIKRIPFKNLTNYNTSILISDDASGDDTIEYVKNIKNKMKKNVLKYIVVIISMLSRVIVYLSSFGLETERLNSIIKNKRNLVDKNIEVELEKIRLTLNPLNFNVNAKTISPNVFYKKN